MDHKEKACARKKEKFVDTHTILVIYYISICLHQSYAMMPHDIWEVVQKKRKSRNNHSQSTVTSSSANKITNKASI